MPAVCTTIPTNLNHVARSRKNLRKRAHWLDWGKCEMSLKISCPIIYAQSEVSRFLVECTSNATVYRVVMFKDL